MTVHRGRAIDQLKIIFPVNSCVECVDNLKVESWIKIAEQKQVKALHLDCKFKHSIRIEKFPLDCTSFSSLVTLRLEKVYLSCMFLDHILSNSPSLLELSIIDCGRVFPRLNIRGPCLKLKHFEISGSFVLRLEISAPNLVSFNFRATEIITTPFRIRFKKVPLLTQLSFSLCYILEAWHDFQVLLPQLVTLILTLSKEAKVKDIGNFPVLVNLKQLHVRLLPDDDKARLRFWLPKLFKASPYVRRLSFDLGTHTPTHNFIKNFPDLKFLEELEIYNFKGFEYELNLLMCIAESCSSLKKVIIIYTNSSKRIVQKKIIKRLAVQKVLKIVFKAVNTNSL